MVIYISQTHCYLLNNKLQSQVRLCVLFFIAHVVDNPLLYISHHLCVGDFTTSNNGTLQVKSNTLSNTNDAAVNVLGCANLGGTLEIELNDASKPLTVCFDLYELNYVLSD